MNSGSHDSAKDLVIEFIIGDVYILAKVGYISAKHPYDDSIIVIGVTENEARLISSALLSITDRDWNTALQFLTEVVEINK